MAADLVKLNANQQKVDAEIKTRSGKSNKITIILTALWQMKKTEVRLFFMNIFKGTAMLKEQ